MLGKLQKQVCGTVGHSLASSLELFSLGITLVDVHLNWLNWFHFHFLILLIPLFHVRLLVILINCVIFLSPFLDAIKMPMPIVSFLAQLDSEIPWNGANSNLKNVYLDHSIVSFPILLTICWSCI